MYLREPSSLPLAQPPLWSGGATNPNNCLDSAERAPNPNPNPNHNPNPENGLNSGNLPDLNGGSNSLPFEAKQVENLTSPYIFKSHINKLSEAIKEEIEKSGKNDPYNPYKLVNALLKAGNIDEKEFKILNNLLENNKFDEFNFKRCASGGWNYLKDFNKIVILDNKIYVTEAYAKYLMTPDQITEAQNNSIYYAPKIKYSFPVVKEVEDTVQAPDKYSIIAGPACSVKEKYLFYSSITDLLNSDSREKIDIRNKTIVSFDKTTYAQQ